MPARGRGNTAQAMAASLQVTGLYRQFGRVTALDGITLAFEEGRLTALLGPAGSGKSELVNIIAGFARPYRGAITIGRAAIDDIPAHRRGFGVMQQREGFFPDLTLRENIALPLVLRKTPRAARERLVDTAIEMTDLGPAVNLRPGQVSAAERQRTALARASVHEPRILLLDEPAGDHHGQARAAMIAAIARIHRLLGATTIIATRDDALALALADNLAVMRDGRVVETGPAEALYERPATAIAAGMIGQSSRFGGVILAVEDDCLRIQLDCGPEVEGAAFEGAAPGARCRLFLRPERVAVAAMGAAEMGDGAIDASVVEVRFGGGQTMLRLLIGAGAELLVQRPSAAPLAGLRPGGSCAVAWQPHHAMVFPA